MTNQRLMRGNDAMAEAAIQAGCRFYFGYPITPQNEVPAYMARRMPEVGGTFLQAESEVAAINMVFGASVAGARAMTSTSSPGMSLKQEGLSYIAACELPAVVANVQRGGPGLGHIAPSQADYWQATKGGGHGDYRHIVLAPHTVQELIELTMDAFDLADFYRIPALLLGDGLLGQMMESVTFPDPAQQQKNGLMQGRTCPPKTWALTGAKGRDPQLIRSLLMEPGALEQHNYHLAEKYAAITKEITASECLECDDADLVIAAYGSSARIAKSAIKTLRGEGYRVGLFRPITVWPFPAPALQALVNEQRKFLVVEMSMGQFAEDIQMAVAHRMALKDAVIEQMHFPGGRTPMPEEIVDKVKSLLA